MNLKILVVTMFALLVLTDALLFRRRRRRRCPTCPKCPTCQQQQAQECVNVCHCVVSKKHKRPVRSIEDELLPCQFEYFDDNKDLFISKAEFFLKAEEHAIFETSEIEIMHKILDKNDDSEISMEEFHSGKRALHILEMMNKCSDN